ncbi:MAG: hypothetical protein SFV22_09760 [Saprospiraceae bacterium]|nr:hypothetical protein [Saprospiraceae bacterium]
MFKPLFYLLWGFATIVVFSNLKCEDESCELFFLLSDWTPAWINNSGATPEIADAPLPRQAFGIRLSAPFRDEFSDLTFVPDTACSLYPVHAIQTIRLWTLTPFDTLPAEAEITQRFMLRWENDGFINYVRMQANDGVSFEAHPTKSPLFELDLLMTEPPTTPGIYQFRVGIQFDSTGTALNKDTSFTLPPVSLL